MPVIEVDQDVYVHLLRNTVTIGESASDILRRLLDVPRPHNDGSTARTSQAHSARTTDAPGTPNEFSECLSDPLFHAEHDVVGKFLFALSYIHRRDPKGFEKVLNLSGRRRKYFGRSSDELKKSGRSVFPKQIPGSPYYVVTNNDTTKKRQVLRDVMRLLRYSDEAINAASSAINHSRTRGIPDKVWNILLEDAHDG